MMQIQGIQMNVDLAADSMVSNPITLSFRKDYSTGSSHS